MSILYGKHSKRGVFAKGRVVFCPCRRIVGFVFLLFVPLWALAAEAASQTPQESAEFNGTKLRNNYIPAGPTSAPGLKMEVRTAQGFGNVKAGKADDAGEFYRAFGRKIRLFRSLEKVAVRARPAEQSKVLLNSAAQMRFELEAAVSLCDMNIFRSQVPLSKDSLRAALAVTDTSPVYINEETGEEMLVTDRFVVRLASGADIKSLDAVNRAHGVVIVAPMHGSDREYVCCKEGLPAPETLVLCEAYHQEPAVEWACPDFVFKLRLYYTPADPLYPNQWHLNNSGQTGGTPDADIDAPEAWDRTDGPRGGSANIVIAIIDTGVDIDHEDLNDNIYRNLAEVNGIPGVDDDGNGYIDDFSGWDFYHNDNNPRPTTDAHGTCCAGIAAAKEGNGLGGVGIAFNCKILPVKIVSDSGIFTSSTNIGNGIRYAADIANVLSNSWGGGGDDSIIHSAIQYAVSTKGKVVLFASGNDADGINSSPAWIQYILTGFSGGSYTFKWEYSKNQNGSAGDDTVWVDDVTFPGGAFEGFEGSFPPSGWTTGGNASWTQYTESKHVRGTGCKDAKAGAIGNKQSTYLQTTRSVGTGNLVFYAWTSSANGDYFKFYVDTTNYFSRSGVPTVDYDVTYPARYSECIAVGAGTDFDRRSQYSQYDETLSHVLDIVAPSDGGNGGTTTTDITGPNGYSSGNYINIFGGTSSATPLAAGIAALILSKNPTLTPAEVQDILQNSADEIGCQSYTNHYNKYYGYGRVNASAALAATPALQYTITASAGVNGTIDPNGVIIKNYGDNQLFTAAPYTDCTVDKWRLDGNDAQTGGTTYILSNIMADHTVNVTFKQLLIAPTIISMPVISATVGKLYSYDVNATGTPAPTYTLTQCPSDMTIDVNTGLIEWAPVIVGDVNVTVEAGNSEGADSQSFIITVLPSDNFDDNRRGAMWWLSVSDYENTWVVEDANRLNIRATGSGNLAAAYMANGWSFDVNEDFSFKVDFHHSAISERDSRVEITVENENGYVSISAGADSNEPYFYYEKVADSNIASGRQMRDSNDGALYISYNTGIDELYLSHTGYGAANAWQTIAGLLRGQWLSMPVSVAVGGSSDNVVLNSGEAYFDNFEITRAKLIGWPPATDLNGSGFIDWGDIGIMGENWLVPGPAGGDFNKDGVVNFLDFAELARAWY
jgi:subtilisin family serine protease